MFEGLCPVSQEVVLVVLGLVSGPDQPLAVGHGGVVVRHGAAAQAGGRQHRLVDRLVLSDDAV